MPIIYLQVWFGMALQAKTRVQTGFVSNIYKSSMNTGLFVNANIGFSENLFLVILLLLLLLLLLLFSLTTND